MADFNINVIVDPNRAVTGVDKIDRRLTQVEKRGRDLTATLRNAFAFVGIGVGIRELIKLTDTFTDAQNKIKLVTTSTAQLNAVTAELFDIAKKTRTPFETTVKLYARTALAVKNLGLTQRETLAFTRAVNQAIIISGASAQEAGAAMIQLSQGLASGTLRGDELRSVLEQLPKVADVIADRFIVTRGELRLLGAQGKISAGEVIKAFADAAENLAKDIDKTTVTIGQAFTILRTNLLQYNSEVDKSLGLSNKFANAILFLAANIQTFSRIAVVAGAALATGFVKRGVLLAIVAVKSLTAAIAANPLGAFAIAAIAAVTALIQFSDQIVIFSDNLIVSADGVVTLSDAFAGLVQFITEKIRPALDFMVTSFNEAIDFVVSIIPNITIPFQDVLIFVKRFVNQFIGFNVGLALAIASIYNDIKKIIVESFSTGVLGFLAKQTDRLLSFLGESTLKLTNFIVDGLSKIKKFGEGLLKDLGIIGENIANIVGLIDFPELPELPDLSGIIDPLVDIGANANAAFISGFERDFVGELAAIIQPAFTDIEKNIREASNRRTSLGDAGLDDRPEKLDRLPFALRQQLVFLEKEAALLKLDNRERKIRTTLLNIERKLLVSSQTTLTSTQLDLLEARIRDNQALKEQSDLLSKIIGPQDALITRAKTLIALDKEREALPLKREKEAIALIKARAALASLEQQPVSASRDKELATAQQVAALSQKRLIDLDKQRTISVSQTREETLQLNLAQAKLNISSGQGTFEDGFLVGIEHMLESVRNFGSEAGQIFADFFTQTSEGFGKAVGDAIVFGESLSESLGNVARQAVSQLISSMVQLGIEFVLNTGLSEALAKKEIAGAVAVQTATVTTQAVTTASSIAASTATTSAIVADNTVIAASAAPAAALESTATFGGAAIAGLAALAAILAFASGSFADGGPVSGPGGPRSDKIPAMLSNGEFVVNAKSTSRFRPQLEAINSGRGFQAGGIVGDSSESAVSTSQPASPGTGGTRIVNVLDPNLMEDFVSTPQGEKVIVNLIERNAGSINQLLGNA